MAQATLTIQTQATTVQYPTARPVVVSGPQNVAVQLGVDVNGNTTVALSSVQSPSNYIPVGTVINISANSVYTFPDNVDVLVLSATGVVDSVTLKLTGTSNQHVCVTCTQTITNFSITATDIYNDPQTVYGVPSTINPTTPLSLLLLNNFYIRVGS